MQVNMFAVEEMCNNPAIFIVGKRGYGKTHLAKDIVHKLREQGKIEECIVFGHDASEFNATASYQEYDKTVIATTMETQIQAHKQKQTPKQTMIVFDDVLFDWNDKTLTTCLLNGRHYNISCIVAMQYPAPILPSIRANIDYVFLYKESIPSIQQKLYDHYAGVFPTIQCFTQHFNEITKEDYHTMVIDYRTTNGKFVNQIIKWYKA